MLADFVFGAIATPLSMVWSVASRPSLALLRAADLRPPPIAAGDVDLSGRVIIVTGANTGASSGLGLMLVRAFSTCYPRGPLCVAHDGCSTYYIIAHNTGRAGWGVGWVGEVRSIDRSIDRSTTPLFVVAASWTLLFSWSLRHPATSRRPPPAFCFRWVKHCCQAVMLSAKSCIDLVAKVYQNKSACSACYGIPNPAGVAAAAGCLVFAWPCLYLHATFFPNRNWQADGL